MTTRLSTTGPPATILLVDDDEVITRVLGRILDRQGYSVRVAGSTGQALALARECRPGLALIDLCLPDGDGIDLGRQLRADDPDVTLLLMTAYPLRLREQPALAAEFARVLTKPLDLSEFRQVVDELLPLANRTS